MSEKTEVLRGRQANEVLDNEAFKAAIAGIKSGAIKVPTKP